ITETTVHVTYRPLTAADTGSRSLIGRPIPDLQLYILDECQQPVPIGVVGEIYVGGAGVTRGYLNRDELTQAKFVPGRSSNPSAGYLYRSGDLARYLSNRDIEYVGRADNQIKIRGFRIEVGEIESLLARHPAVGQCVVVVQEDADDTSLLAYIRLSDGFQVEM